MPTAILRARKATLSVHNVSALASKITRYREAHTGHASVARAATYPLNDFIRSLLLSFVE